MTKRRRARKAIEPEEFAVTERRLEDAFRSLPIWKPEADDTRIPIEWTIPDIVRELAMLRNTAGTHRPWEVAKRKLERLKKYANAVWDDKPTIAALPSEVRCSIAIIANLDTSNPRASEAGAPKKILAHMVAEITAERFLQLTGQRPTRRVAVDGSKLVTPSQAYGPFVEFLDRIYGILAIEASAASQTENAIKYLNKKYPPDQRT